MSLARMMGRQSHWPRISTRRRNSLRRDFIAFDEGFRTEFGICVPREYLLTLGVRQ
jgi:hypothetical protein